MSKYCLGANIFLREIGALSVVEATAWDQLLMSAADLQRAFLSRPYVKAVSEAGQAVAVLVGYEGGEPCFFLPLQRQAGLLGSLGCYEPAGGSMTDYFGLVAKAGVTVDIVALLAATQGAVNAVTYTHLDETQSAFGLVADEYRVGLRSNMGLVPGKFWDQLRLLDKKLVSDTDRREKKLKADCGSLAFEWNSSDAGNDFDWLLNAKKLQYSRTGKDQAPLFETRNVALLRSLLTCKEDVCSGVLSVLRCDEGIIAAHFGLRCQDVMHVWFPVFDRKYANLSPGRILFKHMFEAAGAQQIRLFDRGEGDTPAKRDFANEEHRLGRGVWRAAGMRGHLGLFAQRVAWRLAR